MRLLNIDGTGTLRFTGDLIDVPPYAILSHTWGPDEEEVTYDDFINETYRHKAGYAKIQFCGTQARSDHLEYFWVDSCCIDKKNYTELSEAINSMFRWYREATKCYVYLPDVSTLKRGYDQTEPEWRVSFQNSRWFTRGWTLQELLAPKTVEFYSRESKRLGDRVSLVHDIEAVTRVPISALLGAPLRDFSIEERMRWAEKRNTKKQEDRAYCLLGIFDIFMPLIYGEGENAFTRLKEAIRHPSLSASIAQKEQILQSLNSGSPFTRVNTISQCSIGTFEWILRDQPLYLDERAGLSWDFPDHFSDIKRSYEDISAKVQQFRDWLRRGDGLFWIKGKPGSGKSTFMKFLAGPLNQDSLTLKNLESWTGPLVRPRMFSFYFWLADETRMQNSVHGFLCHLLFQLLTDQSASFVTSLLTADQIRQKQKTANWDVKELEGLVVHVACQIANQTPLCFFIDGLDECLGDELSKVVDVIKELCFRSPSKIKFCVSSRPEQRIANRLRCLNPQHLDFHDLTWSDMMRHVTDTFNDFWSYGAPTTWPQQYDLIHTIVRSAEGVFLWAMLVTKQLCESIESGDTYSQLQDQLSILPRDMMELYSALLEKSATGDDSRKAESAAYFYFVKDYPAFSNYTEFIHCELRLSHFVPLYEHYHGKIATQDQTLLYQQVRQRISVLWGGMVIFKDAYHGNHAVEFFHRTAVDFFCEPSGESILASCTLSQVERVSLFLDGVCNTVKGDGARLWSKDRLPKPWRPIYDICPTEKDARILLQYARRMDGCSDAERESVMKRIEEGLCRAFNQLTGETGDRWAYTQSRFGFGHRLNAIDFTGIRVLDGDQTVLPPLLSKERTLSQKYVDYLLFLCSSTEKLLLACRTLIGRGANPNVNFYRNTWPCGMRTTPWVHYLYSCLDDQDDIGIAAMFRRGSRGTTQMASTAVVENFLDNGARLTDRTILFMMPDMFIQFPRNGRASNRGYLQESPNHGRTIAVEVDARYLLDCVYLHLAENDLDGATRVMGRDDVRNTQAHRRILAVTRKGKNYKVDLHDSEALLDVVGDYIVGTNYHESYDKEDDLLYMIRHRFFEVCEKSPLMEDMWEYFGGLGYCRKVEDPEMLQGPIAMYDDGET